MKFIHAADLHIDSPLLGLACYEGAPAERLREATRRAFENLIALAIDEQVDLVIVAGDLFDGQWRDMQTGLFTARQFRKLHEANIKVYLVRGNHDAASQVRPAISWPPNVYEFSVRKAETVCLDDLGVALHGRGFAQPEVTEDPLLEFPAATPGLFNIGILHTNVDGSPEHDPYAPTSLSALEGKGYDYWALGHIHKRQTLSEHPHIAYAGNTQGRHVRETGAKGCLLVSVEDGELVGAEFRPTDVVRWHWIEAVLDERDGLSAMYASVRKHLEACRKASDGRFVAARLGIAGRCAAHADLLDAKTRAEAIAELRNLANDLDDEVWIEEIRFETMPAVELETLRGGGDLLGDLLRQIESAGLDEAALRTLAEPLAALERHRPGVCAQADLEIDKTEQLRAWLKQAEGILIGHLLSGGEHETA